MAQLIDTKLRPPPLRDERVHRPRLYQSLIGRAGGVVLVSAPPGFGKSTFVVEWLKAESRPHAWYSLDRFDNDAGLFGQYLSRAVGDLTGHESGMVSLLDEPPPDVRSMITTLVDDLVDAPSPAVLVLDDYHEINSNEVHDAVGYFIENLPKDFTLVITTRADPPLPLARLRAQGGVVDIRGDDLRFTNEEIAEYFKRSVGVDLAVDETRVVAERSEGWVSALQLVSIGLSPKAPVDVASALSARQPHIAGYLTEEVLDRLPPDIAQFLLDTSTLDRFDARLCLDLLGGDAARLIGEVDRRNAFLIPLGDEGEWYRYHHLFAELLRARLKRIDPHRQLALLKDAAHACNMRDLPDDAIAYALRAGDLSLAADIVDRHGPAALGAGQVARFRSWLNQFPVPAGPAERVVTLGWAWCRIFDGNQAAANELLDRIAEEQRGESDLTGQIEIMRAMVAFQAGDVAEAESYARKGLKRLAQPSAFIESLGHLYVGRALHAQAKRVEAGPHLERAASLAVRGNTLAAVSALFWLGVADMDMGKLVDAERSMSRAQEVGKAANGPTGDPHPAAGVGDIGLAYIRLNQLDLEEAIRLAERGSRLLKRSTFVEMVFRAFFVWAEALSMAGRFDDSQTVADEGIEWLEGRRMGGGPLETWLMMAQARNSWRRGRLDDSRETLERVRQRGLGSPNKDEALGFYEAADAVSHALRRGEVGEGRRLLEALPHDPTENVMFAIKRHVLAAALHEMEGDTRSAVASMEEALGLAQEGYRFQFSFAGPAIGKVLKRMAGRTKHDDFLRTILERLPAETGLVTEQPIDPLTDREIEVLAEIAAGHSNEQIADRLFISRGTVKRHTSNIFLKLGVHHRAEAAAKGRERRLID